jgi:tRNA(Ile)-lysidine synthase
MDVSMFENLRNILQDTCRLTKDRPIVAGVSGGADSLALLDVLVSAGYKVIVAHLNHKLREEAQNDANAVERLAARMNLLSSIETRDVNAYAREHTLSIEEAARDVRYRFLFAQARKYDAQAVAVGHTADDQVETVLMHFLQGAGLSGLKGMTYRTFLPVYDEKTPLVRPLLNLWHEDTVVYCAMKRLHPHEDVTNSDLSYMRNRLRHLLIPVLESYNPRFREAIWRTSQILAADHQVLTEIVETAWETTFAESGNGYLALNIEKFTSFPVGTQRSLVRRACQLLCATWRDMDFETINRIVGFIASSTPGANMDLPYGMRLFIEDTIVYLTMKDADTPGHWPQAASGVLPVSIPGQVGLPGEWTLTAELWDIPALARERIQKNDDPYQIWLDADRLTGKLGLRSRRPGDRFEPFGMDGHTMKLSDFFINVKLPQRARESWPLLCMGDEIVWVPGYRPAHSFRVVDSTHRIVHFHLTKGGG